MPAQAMKPSLTFLCHVRFAMLPQSGPKAKRYGDAVAGWRVDGRFGSKQQQQHQPQKAAQQQKRENRMSTANDLWDAIAWEMDEHGNTRRSMARR